MGARGLRGQAGWPEAVVCVSPGPPCWGGLLRLVPPREELVSRGDNSEGPLEVWVVRGGLRDVRRVAGPLGCVREARGVREARVLAHGVPRLPGHPWEEGGGEAERGARPIGTDDKCGCHHTPAWGSAPHDTTPRPTAPPPSCPPGVTQGSEV